MTVHPYLSPILASILMVPLLVGIYNKTIRQNFITYFLWAILDLIAAISAYADGGNFYLPTFLCLFGFLTSFLILYVEGHTSFRNLRLSKVEKIVSCFWLISTIFLIFSSNKNATFAALTGLLIASIPQVVTSWKDPKGTPKKLYLGFILVNLLSIASGRDWSINEVGYGISSLIIVTIIFLTSFKR